MTRWACTLQLFIGLLISLGLFADESKKPQKIVVNMPTFERTLINLGLSESWNKIVANSMRKNELLKLSPCLVDLDESKLMSYQKRVKEILATRLATLDTRFTQAISTKKEPKNKRIEKFRAYYDYNGSLRCQVKIGKDFKTIVSDISYLKTPCYELGVETPLTIEDSLQLMKGELEPKGESCSISHWKYHVLDYAWKNVLSNKNFIQGAINISVKAQSDLIKMVLKTSGVNNVGGL